MNTENDEREPFADPDEQRVVFSNPELREIETALRDSFGAAIDDDESFTVAAALSGDHLEMVVELANFERTKVCRLHAATEVAPRDAEDFVNGRADLVEFEFAMMEEYLATSRLNALHIDWKEYDYNGRTIYFRSILEDEKARKMADDWLETHDPDRS